MKLDEEEYAEKKFAGQDFRPEKISGVLFENCDFVKCSFSAAKNCRFVDCRFQNCDLSNWQVHGSSFRDCRFRDSKMIGINWANASGLASLLFESCVLNLAGFVGLNLRGCAFQKCLARETDFADANLAEVDCLGSDFAGARFSKTDLTKADFRGAMNYSIRPDDNNLKNAKFSLPEATLLLYGLGIDLEE